MSVSYLSEPISSNPYVLPLDLGLFSKVMSIKQQAFDTNAAKVQASIDNLGLLDVMKDNDREYLNSKINNLVTSINSYGGIDFSDQNVLNQIEGLGSDIYSDNKVLSAISSTKAVRKLQSAYEKYKTDPKLSKMYSEVNEAWDMRGIQEYMSNPEVGAKYSGPTNPTPYTDYRTNHLKAFEKMKTDLQTTLTDNGLYYSKVINDYITPERIMSMAADLLTPNEREQMKRDGWYVYRGYSPSDLVKKGYEQFSAKKSDAEKMLQYYKSMADAAVTDPAARRNYNILAQKQQEVVDSFSNAEGSFVDNFLTKLKENPEDSYYQLYSSDYFRGLGNRFSVNRTDRTIIANQAEMFRQRMLQADQQFKETMNFKNRELDIKITQNEEQNAIELLKIGKYRHINPITGQVDYLDLPGYRNGELVTDSPNIENPSDLKVTKTTLENNSRDLKLQNDQLIQDYVSNIVALHPELGVELQSGIGKGYTRKLKGQDLIEGFNNQPGLQAEDFQLFEQVKDAEGYPVFKNQKQVQQFALKNRLNTKQLEFFANQWKNFEALALGKGETVPDLVDGFPELAKKVVLNNEQITANQTKLNAVVEEAYSEILAGDNRKALEKYGIKSAEDLNRVLNKKRVLIPLTNFDGTVNNSNDIISNMQRWFINLGNDSDLSPVELLLKNSITSLINKKLEPLSTRDVYGIKPISDKDPNLSNLSKIALQEILDNKAEPYGDSPKLSSFAGIPATAVKPRMIGKANDGSNRWMVISDVEVGSGEKKATLQYKTYLTDENAKSFGLVRDPYEQINYSVSVTGRTGDIPVYATKKLSAFVNVVGLNANNLNDRSAIAQIVVYELDKNGQKTNTVTRIKIPATEGRTPSESFALAEAAIKKAGQLGLSYNEFVSYLESIKNQ